MQRRTMGSSGASRSMRRGLAVIAGLLLTVTAAAGCLGKDPAKTDPGKNRDVKEFELVITANAIKGGKNAAGATWLEDWVIPKFVEAQKGKGKTAKVTFQASGADDAAYKQNLALDLGAKKGPDVIAIDGIWVGEFAEAQHIASLDKVVGKDFEKWDGWAQIPDAVQRNFAYKGQRYGIPQGTDGRVIYFNKKLFAQAGLPANWQPTSWAEILDTAGKLRTALPGVTPLQLNACHKADESNTMQGFLPLLVGAGQEIYSYDTGKWQGDTPAVREALGFYEQVYKGGLADGELQKETECRNRSFDRFSKGRLAMLLESDFLWRGVVEPAKGTFPIADRNDAVGWAKIPAKQAKGGIRGQDFVSMSGGSGYVLNPSTKFPQQAWELLSFMNSAEAIKAQLAGTARVTHRKDVNAEVLKSDPMLSFISEQVLPITAYRPGFATYPRVSAALQQAILAVTGGKSPKDAAAEYQRALKDIVGEGNVASG